MFILPLLLGCAPSEGKPPAESGEALADTGCAPEVCDGADNDCDGTIDEDATDAPTWYADADGDGYGDDANVVTDCDAPPDHVANGGDCDDRSAAVHPGATERCDDTDEDCDGAVDEDLALTTAYPDADGDGYGAAGGVLVCEGAPGTSARADDCDDALASVFPGAEETCEDGVDNDCDGADTLCGPSTADAVASRSGENGYAWSGWAAAGLGDTDGDGYDDIAIGSYLDDLDGSHGYVGAVYVEPGPVTGTERLDVAPTRIAGDRVNRYFGVSLAGPGDLDGDGLADVLIGASGAYLGAGDRSPPTGAAFVFLSGRTGHLQAVDADVTIRNTDVRGDEGEREFGGSVVAAGDVDGDGWRDIAVGAPGFYATGASSAGAYYVFTGPLTGELTEADATTTIYGDAPRDMLGFGGSGGDLDGDGLDDLAVGAPGESTVAAEAGAVYVFLGGGAPASVADADRVVAGAAEGQRVGWDASVAPDLDGDGGADLLIGAPGTAGIHAYGGAVYVFHGLPDSSSGIDDADAQLHGSWANATASPAAAVGDLDGDGASELLVGRTSYLVPGEPGAWLLYGPLSGTHDLATAPVAYRDAAAGDASILGYTVESAGDVDGNGEPDLLVGDPGYASAVGWGNQGITYVFSGAGG